MCVFNFFFASYVCVFVFICTPLNPLGYQVASLFVYVFPCCSCSQQDTRASPTLTLASLNMFLVVSLILNEIIQTWHT